MIKSATEVMQEILVAAILDSIEALKAGSKGVPNILLRDLNAVHSNTTFADLPKELQAAITAAVRAAFTRLMREGYSVTAGQAAVRSAPPRADSGTRREPARPRDAAGRGPRPDRPPGKPGGSGGPGGAPHRRGGRPPGKPRPPRG